MHLSSRHTLIAANAAAIAICAAVFFYLILGFVGDDKAGAPSSGSARIAQSLQQAITKDAAKDPQLFGFYSKTITPGDSIKTDAFRLQANYEWNGLRLNFSYQQVSEGFNPEVGFLLRSAYRKPEVLIFKQVRMNGRYGLLELRPHVSYRGYWNFDNFLETSFLHVDNHWVWVNMTKAFAGQYQSPIHPMRVLECLRHTLFFIVDLFENFFSS